MMARTKATDARIEATARRTAEILSGTEIEQPGDPDELDALEALATLGGDSSVRFVVKRIKPYDRTGQILSNLPREDLLDLPERLTDQFGPGKYEVFAKGSNGQYLKGRHAVIEISPDAVRSNGTPASSQTGAPAPAAPSSAADMVRELEARNEARRLEAREDRKWLVETVLGALPAIVTLVQGRPAPSLAEQINALGGLKELTGGGQGNQLQTLLEGVRLAKELGGEATPESWQGIVGEGLKTVQALITRSPTLPAARPPAQLPPAAANPAPALAAPAPAAPAAEPPQGQDLAAARGAVELTGKWAAAGPLLHKLADEIIEYAQTEADADLAANALLAKVPPTYLRAINPAELLELIERPDWWSFAVRFHPALSGRHQYVDGIRQSLIKMLTAPASESSGAGAAPEGV